jgi:2-polyprenyl-3-methyl-5-hydroxy-6-metoxy-1,4-benzoquinol methylase
MSLQPADTLVENRYEFVAQYVAANSARTDDAVIFDIGAGALPMRNVVEAAGYRLRGFDLVPQSAEIERWDITEPFQSDAKADIVLLMDVIEHTFNPGMAIANVRSVLKPGGVILMTMPNPRWSRARTMHFLSGYIAAFDEHDLNVNHHVFATWPHIVLKMCTEAGLKMHYYATLDKLEGRKVGISPLRMVEAGLRKIMEARDKSACGMHYVFILK